MLAPSAPYRRVGWQQSKEAGDWCIPPCAQPECLPLEIWFLVALV